jgi:transposase
MSERDYNKQLKRRQKIGDSTLVVGVDIGCKFNAVALMNKGGEVLGTYPKVYNSRKGFDYFVDVVEGAKTEHDLKEVLIGMEPTGHYWRKLAFFVMERGYAVRFVRTTALKHAREINESSSSKSDVKDALTITNITREGKTIDTVIEDGVYRELRTLAKVREKILKHSVSSQATLGAVLDDYFPEVKDLFCSMKTRSLWATLERCPFPEDVLKMRVSTLTKLIAKSSRRGTTAAEKAKKLYQAAREGIGLKRVSAADRYRLKMCLEEVKRTEVMLKGIKKEMKQLLEQIPCAEYILSIPGVGPITAAVFLGELGNPEYFKHPKQIVKYAGYDPQEKDSGKRIGRRFISKKGRWLLRKYIFFMTMKVTQNSDFFKDYYKRKLENKNRFGQLLKKREALCAVAIKLIKVIFALLRDKRRFSDNIFCLALAA